MKDGTGGDPFADDPVDSPTETEADSGTDIALEAESETESETTTQTDSQTELPYIYARETVKEDRDQVPFFLREFVQDLEEEFIDDLEERLGESVYKADAREAALEVMYENHVEEAAAELREWGYGR